MALLPTAPTQDPTLAAVNAAIEAANAMGKPRAYLGMSAIGMDCERFLWLNFHWCGPAGGGFDAKALRNFADGHAAEEQQAARLRLVPGVELYTVDPSTGQQFGFSDLGGHFRGHIDGAIRGILLAPKAWHMWEHKASDGGPAKIEKAKLKYGEKGALAEWNPTYYAQAVLYMHYGAMERHYLTCSSPGGRLPEASIRTNASPEDAARFIAKAERIIFSPEPLPKISDDAAFWKCKDCAMSRQCHGQALPAVNCRTCLHSTPERDGDGRWSCALAPGDTIPAEFQVRGCSSHLMVPSLLSKWGEAVDANEAEGWVEYKAADGYTFRNSVASSPGHFTSAELKAATPALLRDAQFMAIRDGGMAGAQGTIVDKAA